MLREELQLLQEQGSYVGEVVKPMDKKKVLVKVIYLKHFCNIFTFNFTELFMIRLPYVSALGEFFYKFLQC